MTQAAPVPSVGAHEQFASDAEHGPIPLPDTQYESRPHGASFWHVPPARATQRLVLASQIPFDGSHGWVASAPHCSPGCGSEGEVPEPQASTAASSATHEHDASGLMPPPRVGHVTTGRIRRARDR